MDDLVRIEQEKSALFEHLDQHFPLRSLNAVTTIAPAFCGLLCEQLRERIINLAPRLFAGGQARLGSHPAVEFEGREYRIQYTTEPLTDREKLPFVIMEYGGDGPPSPNSARAVIPLTNIAQYKAIEFSIDSALPVDADFLDALTRGVFSAGYQWLSNRLVNAIRTETAKISTSLYDYMRSMLAEKPELLEGFLFSCLMNRRDFVILDEMAAASALRLADLRAIRYQRPKESIVLHLLGEVVDDSDSVITSACAHDAPTMAIALNNDSKYYRTDPQFFDAMAAVWGKEVTCHPIVKRGDLRVVAFYPSAIAAELTPLVTVHAGMLEKIVEKQAGLIREHLKLLESVLPRVGATPVDKQGRWLKLAEVFGVAGGTFGGRFVKNVL